MKQIRIFTIIRLSKGKNMTTSKSNFSVAKCRKILGKKYDRFTDEQILEIRDFLYMLIQMDKRHLKEREEKLNSKK